MSRSSELRLSFVHNYLQILLQLYNSEFPEKIPKKIDAESKEKSRIRLKYENENHWANTITKSIVLK